MAVDFRRGAYDRFLLNQMDLTTAMDLVGHKSLSSARRYARPNVDRMRAALESVRQRQQHPHTSRTADQQGGV